MPDASPPTILLTSFLAGSLKWAGPLCAPRAAAAFLERAGREREVFLPFFYRWFDERQWAQDQALRLMRVAEAHERIVPPRVFHAPFAGRYGPFTRAQYRDLADPDRLRDHQEALRRECAFFGRVRAEFGIVGPLLYILHLGRRRGRGPSETLATALEAIRPAVEVAHEHGVILSIENVADRPGDAEYAGGRLTEIQDALGHLGGERAPVGWTFDVSHALLAYRGDVAAVLRDLGPLLPSLVHIHINAPRFYPSEISWGDRHEAPTEGFRPLWDLFGAALMSPRFREFRTVTYEVNWAAPFLNPLVGGSPLAAVARGYDLVRRVAAGALGTLDAEAPVPYTLERAGATVPALGA